MELAIRALQEVIINGNGRGAVKAIEVLFKHVLPKPREAQDTGDVERLMELLARTRIAEARDVEVFAPTEPDPRLTAEASGA